MKMGSLRMRMTHALSLLLCSSLIFQAETYSHDLLAGDTTVHGSSLHVMGRSEANNATLELISSGAHFGVSFEGRSCVLVVSLGAGYGHSYLQYELDGIYQKRLRVSGGSLDTIRINAGPEGEHCLWIFKATEAHTGPIYIHSVRATALKPLPVKTNPIIEFIGNSITCGAAADPSDVPCGTGQYHDQHNAYLSFGARVAREVGAEFVLSSVSGIGIYRNWNSDSPIMPEVYDKADFTANSSRRWDFQRFTPAIVSIALGTNDFSKGDGKRHRDPFDSVVFTNQYVSFIKNIRSRYPDALIVLLNSPMISGKDNEIFIECLKRVKSRVDKAYPRNKPVNIFLVDPMHPAGCSYHPSTDDHAKIAAQLIPHFKALLPK